MPYSYSLSQEAEDDILEVSSSFIAMKTMSLPTSMSQKEVEMQKSGCGRIYRKNIVITLQLEKEEISGSWLNRIIQP